MPTPSPSRTNLEKELVLIWEQVLQRAPIGIHDDFFELGGTSGQAAGIFARIEEVFQKRLPISIIIGAPTIARLAPSLLPGKSCERKAYVVPIQSEGEKPVLFCIGEGVLWRSVSEYLGPDQPVFSIEMDPGAAEQLKGPNAMEKIARHMVSALCEKQSQGPYYLCGYCLDGVYAYEIARQLKLYGHEIGLLAMVEARNPSPDLSVRFINGLRRNAIRLAFQIDQAYQLSRKGGLSEYLRARREELGRFAMRVLLHLSPVFRPRVRESGRLDSREFQALEIGLTKPKPLACPTAIFRCEDWPTYSAGDPYFGWRELLKGRIETHEIPGGHKEIFREPNVRVLAEKLRACLQAATQPETPHNEVILHNVRSLIQANQELE